MRRLLVAAALSVFVAACGHHTPPNPLPSPSPNPTPTPGGMPAKGVPVSPKSLLRQTPQMTVQTNEANPKQVRPTQAEPCCMPWARCPNTGWPLASECFMDETHTRGAVDSWHFRLGPWKGDAQHEDQWAAIGGPYKDNTCCAWNDAYWQKVRELAWHAHQIAPAGIVEVVPIDSWYIKVCRGDPSLCPWPVEDIQAAGKEMTPVQEDLLRKSVEELGCFGWITWTTGNEEDNVPGMSVSWLNREIEIIRDAEKAVGCGFVHMIGTGSWKDGINADYTITHERSAVAGPCLGRWCVNNEHNPAFDAGQEADYFSRARDAGQVWAAWRAEASDADWEKRLDLFHQVVAGGGPGGCYAPDPEDPLWIQPPAAGGQIASDDLAKIRQAVKDAEAAVGDRCGSTEGGNIHMGSLHTLGLLGDEMRSHGWCVSAPWVDALAVVDPTSKKTLEFHAVAFATGCYSSDQSQNPKNTWSYGGAPPATPPPGSACNTPLPPPLARFAATEHTKGPNWTTLDSTPLVHDQAYCAQIGFTDGRVECPVRQEGAPDRAACEAQIVGTPQWSMVVDAGGTAGHVSPENPYQYLVPRGTSGVATVCGQVNGVCGSVGVTK